MHKHDHESRFSIRRLLTPVLGALALVLTMGVWAQWQWVDSKGVTHFSDSAPPASVPDKDIIRKPLSNSQPIIYQNEPTKVEPTEAAAPSSEEIENEKKLEEERLRLKAEQAAATAEKERQDALEKQRACDSAKLAVQRYTSGLRIRDLNAKGEYTYLTEDQITQRLKDARANTKKFCN